MTNIKKDDFDSPKELSEMTLEELWNLFPIILKEHNISYKEWFDEEKMNIKKFINKEDIKRINHIGSSAVKGLISKPTVDILPEISKYSDIDKISELIIENGWGLMSSKKDPYIDYVFNKGYTKYGFEEKVYHLHVRTLGDWKELYFRDYLIEYSDIATEYGKLKLKLRDKYEHNRDAYTEAKTEFISYYTNEAKLKYKGRYI